jgi:hypothetical protein
MNKLSVAVLTNALRVFQRKKLAAQYHRFLLAQTMRANNTEVKRLQQEIYAREIDSKMNISFIRTQKK